MLKTRTVLVATILASAVLAGGCASDLSRLSDKHTLSITELERVRQRYVEPDASGKTIEQQFEETRAADRKAFRDNVIHGRMRIVDAVFDEMSKTLRRSRAAADTGVDVTVLTLSAIGSLVTPASTKSILHAVSGGLIGARASVAKNFFEDFGAIALVERMEASRAVKRAQIEQKMLASDSHYGIGEALRDCDQYLQVGTVDHALLELNKESGALKKRADDTSQQIVDQRIPLMTRDDVRSAAELRVAVQAIADDPTLAAKARDALFKLDPSVRTDDDAGEVLLDYLADTLGAPNADARRENLRKALDAAGK